MKNLRSCKRPDIKAKANITKPVKVFSPSPVDILYIGSAILGVVCTVDAYFYTGPTKDMAYKHELEIIQDLNKTDKKILELMRVLDEKIEKNSRAIITLETELKNFEMNVSKEQKIDS